jgi:hypothetical protein
MSSFEDLLYAFTEWLRTTPLVELSLSISEHPVSLLIQTNFWAIPTLQTLHILAIAAAFGAVLMLNFRVLGLAGGSRTMEQTVRRYVPWIWWALAALIVTGIGMVVGEPVRELINPIFWIKMGMIVIAIALSLWFFGAVRRNMARWEAGRARGGVRAGAAVLILLWCTIMVAGRWIAYAPV